MGGLRLLAEKNHNQVHLEACNPCWMTSDPMRLRQVLNNLLSNACKFTQDGQVWLSASQVFEQEQEWIEFVVRDSGIGMSAEQVERLFRPFTQADSSTTRKFGGTGLGLAISYQLIQLMGGTIRVESREGEGSKFVLRLPVTQDQGSSSPAGQS
jgi:signal transduction histidine kinase